MAIIEKIEVLKVKFSKNWVLEVTDNKPQETKEFWLYHEQYGIKEMMFGLMAKETELIQYYKDNIKEESKLYRLAYIDQYIDDERNGR